MRQPLAALAVIFLCGSLSVPDAAASRASDQVLVAFEQGVTDAQASRLLQTFGAVGAGEVYGTDVKVVRGPQGLARRLDSHPLVEYAEPDHVYRLLLDAPNDARFAEMYAHERIQSVAGWASYPGSYTTTGGPTIAVLDTGIDSSHEDLSARSDTANSRCFLGTLFCLGGFADDNGHGTHVAGTAVASTNNGAGVAGVAFNARVMALKVCDLLGTCSTSAVASAINWARDRGARVVSMSFGGSGASTTMHNAIKSAHSAGLVLVAAAGNNGNSTLNYPAAFPEVISVAATDAQDRRASFSNTNSDVEVAAPGVGVLSTRNGGGYHQLSGTSMSAPHVSGLAALLLGQNPDWSNEQVRARLHACSDDLGDPGRDNAFGYGRINLARALGTC